MPWLPILQFVAKVHEMSIQASIVAVVFTYMSSELTDHHLPFGGIFAGMQVTQLSYFGLWSSGEQRFLSGGVELANSYFGSHTFECTTCGVSWTFFCNCFDLKTESNSCGLDFAMAQCHRNRYLSRHA